MYKRQVFGRRAAIDAVQLPNVDAPATAPQLGPSEPPPSPELKDALWRDAGLVRDGHGLEQLIEAPHTVVRLIAEAALTRKESRGVHFRADFPFEDEHFHAHVVQRRGHEPVLEAWA